MDLRDKALTKESVLRARRPWPPVADQKNQAIAEAVTAYPVDCCDENCSQSDQEDHDSSARSTSEDSLDGGLQQEDSYYLGWKCTYRNRLLKKRAKLLETLVSLIS